MKTFDLVSEQTTSKKLEWTDDPSIGWFLESNPCRLYIGANEDNISDILENGIFADDDGYIKCALEPHTAHFNAMPLTESVSDDKRVIVVVDLPQGFTTKNPIYTENNKVTNKELYEGWGKSDVEYYALVEVFVPKYIPVNYIKGYMVKNDS